MYLHFIRRTKNTRCMTLAVGVCEPVDSENCTERNTFDPCIPIDFECDGMNETGKNMLIRRSRRIYEYVSHA